MSALRSALEQAGGARAGREHGARLREALSAELARGARELALPRSGYGEPVLAAFAAGERLAALLPVPAALRADPDAAPERSWLVAAAAVDALVHAAEREGGALLTGEADGGRLALALDAPGGDAELAVYAFEEAVAGIDRLRAAAVEVPGHVVAGQVGELRPPIGATHPLRIAEAVARLGGHPADPASVAAHEEAVLALIGAGGDGAVRPHEDPDPSMRVARRILQRLDGMGKWGGYHTDFTHLARGFAGNDRALADAVGEALLDAGLLSEKPSVGQRHVFLNPRRAGDIRRLIDDGAVPPGLRLPS
jgi:hypothetical protein